MPHIDANRRPIADIFRSSAHAAVRWCAQKKVHPNTISYCSIVASLAAGISFAFASQRHFFLLNAVAFCFVRLYCNMLDGMVAIETQQTSKTGEIANELPDRISDVLIFVGIAHSGLCHMLLGYWAAILSLVVAYVGTLGQAVGAHREFSGPMSKPWRMVVLGIGGVSHWVLGTDGYLPEAFGAIDIATSVIIFGCVLTFFTRLGRIIKALKITEARPNRESA